MKIPQFLYGRYSTVMSRCNRIAKQIVATGRHDLFDPAPFLDTTTSAGLIMLEKDAMVTLTTPENFYCFAFASAIVHASKYPTFADSTGNWLRWALEEPWRF